MVIEDKKALLFEAHGGPQCTIDRTFVLSFNLNS
jgi:hypothetical protein